MLLTKAEAYLKDVLEHKRCIPFSRYDHSVGRCSAAIQFGLTKGRYPEKSVRIILNLLRNAKANAETKSLNVDKMIIKNINLKKKYILKNKIIIIYLKNGKENQIDQSRKM